MNRYEEAEVIAERAREAHRLLMGGVPPGDLLVNTLKMIEDLATLLARGEN